jgi:hypothetical protein
MSKVDWRQKYYELRSKYMNAIDVAFRLGVQEGQKNQKMQDMEMQLQQMQEAAMMGGGEELPPEEGMEPGMEGGEELPPEAMAAEGAGDELDASIDELEQYVKHEDKKDLANLLKSFHANKKSEKTESKDSRSKKLNSILKKWDEEDAETQSDDNDVMGQA